MAEVMLSRFFHVDWPGPFFNPLNANAKFYSDFLLFSNADRISPLLIPQEKML